MSFIDEINSVKKRLSAQISRISNLLKHYDVSSLMSLVRVYRSNRKFREEWKSIWAEIVRDEGGKLSLTTIGAIIGAAFGGVGIAAGGGAIGLPLALILGLGGFVAGVELDAFRVRSNGGTRKIKVPLELYKRLKAVATDLDIRVEELVKDLLEATILEFD
jgi:hypothetical protein